MENYMWLETPIHINHFKGKLSDELVAELSISIDGSIMAINPSLINEIFDSDDSTMIRLGMKNLPRDFKVSCDETFKKFLSYQNYLD